MLTSTIYDVRIKYSVDGRGAAGVRALTTDVRGLGRESDRVAGAVKRLGAAVIGAFGVRAAGKALIGFNATVEDTKLQIAGMLALTKKTDLADQVSRADTLYRNLQRRAASLPGTTREYAQMAGMITQPIIDAGLGMKDLEDLTVNAVVGAKALGVQWEVAARDIDQALRGQFKSVDQFTGKILGSIGYKGEDGRARFNALDAGKRADVLRDAMMQKQLVQLAAAQGETFSGMVSQLQDAVEQFFGKVGKPLFRIITSELKAASKWLDENQHRVDAFAQRLADGLVTGFHVVKDAVSFLVDHAGTLLAVGKVWAAVKIGSMLGGIGGRGGSGAAGMIAAGFGAGGWFRGARDSFDKETGEYKYTPAGRGRSAVGGLRGVADNAGLLGASLGAGYALGNAIGLDKLGQTLGTSFALLTGRTDKATLAFEALQRSQAAYDKTVQENIARHRGPQIVGARLGVKQNLEEQANVALQVLKAKQAIERGDSSIAAFSKLQTMLGELRELGVTMDDIGQAGGFTAFAMKKQMKADVLSGNTAAAGAFGVLAFQGALTQLTEYQKKTLDHGKAQQDLLVLINQNISRGVATRPEDIINILRNATDDPSGKHKPNMSGKPNVNITIQRIEVQSDDPDRYAFQLVDAFQDAVKNPSQAVRAIREG